MVELCGYAFQLGQPFHDGIFSEFSDAVQMQLVHDVLAVRFYGFHAQVEAGGNVPGGFAFRKKLQHLALTAGKRWIAYAAVDTIVVRSVNIVLDDDAGYCRAQIYLAGADAADGMAQFIKSTVLQQIPASACLEHLGDELLVRVHGQAQHLHRRRFLFLPGGWLRCRLNQASRRP